MSRESPVISFDRPASPIPFGMMAMVILSPLFRKVWSRKAVAV
jgi:hypothetical protein